jgi:hypothetical protein
MKRVLLNVSVFASSGLLALSIICTLSIMKIQNIRTVSSIELKKVVGSRLAYDSYSWGIPLWDFVCAPSNCPAAYACGTGGDCSTGVFVGDYRGGYYCKSDLLHDEFICQQSLNQNACAVQMLCVLNENNICVFDAFGLVAYTPMDCVTY